MMKKLLIVALLAIAAAATGPVRGQTVASGNCGTEGHEADVTWVLTGELDSCTLTISGTGAMADYPNAGSAPWYGYKSNITSIIINEGVTTIGNYAFYGYSNAYLTSITIPASVQTIGNHTLRQCTKLQSVTFAPNSQLTTIGSSAFYQCSSLQSITFAPNSQLTTIGSNAFQNCSSLLLITIPASVTSINPAAFANCTSLQSLDIADGSQLETIQNSAFDHCGGLTSISFAKCLKMTSVGNNTFQYCSNLVSVTLPESMTSIGNWAFRDCTKLDTIIIHAPSLTTYGGNTFYNITTNYRIYVPAASLSTYRSAWSSYYTHFRAIPVPAPTSGTCGTDVTWALSGTAGDYTLTISGTGAMSNFSSIYTMPWYSYRSEITDIVIEGGVTFIGSNAFNGCANSNLTSVSIPASVTTIGDNAFNGCSYLQSVTFANGSQLKSIGNNAFQTCTRLTSISFPASVERIGIGAFSSCTNMTTVSFAANSRLKSIGREAFNRCNNLLAVSIPDSVSIIGYSAFDACSKLASLSFSTNSQLTTIDQQAFRNTALTSVTIPASVRYILNAAFGNCSYLASVTFAEGSRLANIGSQAFRLTALTSVTIPASVKIINSYAFQQCAALDSVTILAPSLTTYGSNAFQTNAEGRKIYVPEVSVTTYKQKWTADASAIEAIPLSTTVTPDPQTTPRYTLDSIPMDWTVTANGNTMTLTPYPTPNEDYGYAVIDSGASVVIGPSNIDTVSMLTVVPAPLLTPVVTAPTAISNLTYTADEQPIANPGTTSGGTMMYSLDGTKWSTAIPKGINAGSYTLYYKVVGEGRYASVAMNQVNVSIAKAALPAITFSVNSHTFPSDLGNGEQFTFEVDCASDGNLSISSSSTDVASATVVGKTVRVTRVSNAASNFTITVSVAAGTNYNASTNATKKIFYGSNVATPTAVPLGHAELGYKIASDGLAYPPTATLPSGVTLVGMVGSKSGHHGIAVKKNYETNGSSGNGFTYAEACNFSSPAGEFCVNTTDSYEAMVWRCGELGNYMSIGVGSDNNETWSKMQNRLIKAGCEQMNLSGHWTRTQSTKPNYPYWFLQNTYYPNSSSTGGCNASYHFYLRALFNF